MATKILFLSWQLAAFVFGGYLSSPEHPFYLSVVEIKYNGEQKQLQASVRIFANDLEAALSKKEGKRVDLLNPPDIQKANVAIMTYLASVLKIDVNGKPGKSKMLGFEKEEETIWVYLDIDCPQNPKTLKVTNTVLCETIPAQSNIVHVDLGNGRQSARLDCADPIAEFTK